MSPNESHDVTSSTLRRHEPQTPCGHQTPTYAMGNGKVRADVALLTNRSAWQHRTSCARGCICGSKAFTPPRGKFVRGVKPWSAVTMTQTLGCEHALAFWCGCRVTDSVLHVAADPEDQDEIKSEWVSRCCSRLWRGSMKKSVWKVRALASWTAGHPNLGWATMLQHTVDLRTAWIVLTLC